MEHISLMDDSQETRNSFLELHQLLSEIHTNCLRVFSILENNEESTLLHSERIKLAFLWCSYASIIINYTQRQNNKVNIFIRTLCLEISLRIDELWVAIAPKEKQEKRSEAIVKILGKAHPYQFDADSISKYHEKLLRMVGILQEIGDPTTLGQDPVFSGNVLYRNTLITELFGQHYKQSHPSAASLWCANYYSIEKIISPP